MEGPSERKEEADEPNTELPAKDEIIEVEPVAIAQADSPQKEADEAT